MRRLVIEVSEKELAKIEIKLPQFTEIKSLELLYFLRQDQQEFAAISEIEFKDPNYPASKVEELLEGGFLVEAQVLEKSKNGGYIVFMRGGPSLSSVLASIGIEEGYLFPPLGIREGQSQNFISRQRCSGEEFSGENRRLRDTLPRCHDF